MSNKAASSGSGGGAPPPANSGAPNLDNAAINLKVFREHGRKELVDVLDSVSGAKALVLDPKLSGPLGLIAEIPLLREHQVEKIYHLQPGRLDTECPSIVYLVRPKVDFMKFIAQHILSNSKSGTRKHYSVFFVPRSTMIAERVLEEEGVYGDITIGQYHLDLIPFDDDILSLELDGSFRECFLEGDRTSLFYVARSLMKLQSMFGIIPKIQGIGDGARLVKDMLLRMRKELGSDEPTVLPEIDSLILIDRKIDMVTPMPTQLTYEGLVDEVFGINNSYVDLDPEIVAPEPKAGEKPPPPTHGKKVKHAMNSNDTLLSEIRDLNFSALGPVLNRKAKEIDEHYQRRHGVHSISEIRDYMRTIGSVQAEHRSLRIHTNIAERISSVTKSSDFHSRLQAEQTMLMGGDEDIPLRYIDEVIAKSGPLLKVLRLLILYSLTNNGIPNKFYEGFRRGIIQSYGYEYLPLLSNLSKLGLFKRQGDKGSFSIARKSLRLLVPDVNDKEPDDISYVYSGYAPISVRLVQYAHKPGWASVRPSLEAMSNGSVFQITQELPGAVAADVEKKAKASLQQGLEKRSVTLVFFLGGVTFTEISALRYLHKHEEGKRDFIIATTKLINGDSILNSIISTLDS